LKERFTDAPWSSPESDLEVGAFCSVCLLDWNSSGEEKVKEKCALPIRSKPGAPISKAALRNAAARINQVKGAPAEKKAAALKRLNSLKKAAGIGESSED
jgi:hypothetical protein